MMILMHNKAMYKDFAVEFGNKIKSERIKRGWSQEQLSYESGLSKGHIGMLETAKRSLTLPKIFQLSRAFGIDIPTLFDFDDLKKFTFEPPELSSTWEQK